jgi:hypothetical protein
MTDYNEKFGLSGPSRLVTTQSIAVHYDGKSKVIKNDHPNYERAKEAIKEADWNLFIDLLSPDKVIAEKSDGKFKIRDDQVFIQNDDGSEFALPSELNKTVLMYMEDGLEYNSLIKFATKLQRNPSYRSVQQLFRYISSVNMTITEDGDFIAYKSVREDFKDQHSGTFDNSIGNVVEMPRNQVDDNPDNHCSNGLHVASYNYANNVYRGPVTLYVSVNPEDVVSVPKDHNNEKIRTCRYKVLGISKGEMKTPYFYTEEYLDNEDEDEDEEKDVLCLAD